MWFRAGARHALAFNPVFVALLAALAVASGMVLAWSPLTRRFGLPTGSAVQALGAALLLLGALIAVRTRRTLQS
jgi:hypothetical protein